MGDKYEKNIKNFNVLKQEFMRHLSENSNINELSKEFGALRTNFERVDFVLHLLENVEGKIYFYANKKCDKVAANLREEGNKCFKSKKLYEALELYTKSICYAEKNSIDLSLAYANRSAVLNEINLNNSCLEVSLKLFNFCN